MSKVSVIIPIYNTEKHLQKCLESVTKQTLEDIEIICVNDASTDNSLEILNNYSQRDKRIKIINLDENKGAGAARNIGIEASNGEYIGFMDSDDYVDSDFYEKLYTKAKSANSQVVKGKLYLYNPSTNEIRIEDWIDINDKIKKHKANFYFNFTSAIFKRNLIINNDIRFLEGQIHFEDPYFTIKAGLFYDAITVVDDAKYYYVENTSSTSRNPSRRTVENQVEGSIKILELLNEKCNDITHYSIVFSFVMEQLLCWAYSLNRDDMFNKIAASGINKVLDLCKYRQECLEYYFLNKKFNNLRQQRKDMIEKAKIIRERIKNSKKDGINA